ncbi:hypothetical protein JHK85_045314 [Glycine max]|nr:hypothetical protein JHK86_044703 [Glycine max]KAG4951447.1 hypothetical protein JHK85_045314 [Glycine max]
MILKDKVVIELGIRSPAVKFFNAYAKQLHNLPNVIDTVHDNELHEGVALDSLLVRVRLQLGLQRGASCADDSLGVGEGGGNFLATGEGGVREQRRRQDEAQVGECPRRACGGHSRVKDENEMCEVTIGVKGESEMCSRHGERRVGDGKVRSKTQKRTIKSRHDLSSVVGECHGSVPMYLGIHSDLGLTETPQLGEPSRQLAPYNGQQAFYDGGHVNTDIEGKFSRMVLT